MQVSDEDLARAAQGGDRQAFETLVERVYDRLFRLCFRLTGAQSEAEDLTQDICAALPAKLQSFRGSARVTTWLYRVAVNAANDRRRRQASYARAVQGWGDWAVDQAETAAEAQGAAAWLQAAMGGLPEPLRDTLALALDDLSHAEIGDVLGIAEGTVSWRISEAKKHLRTLHQEEEQA